jgi:hypothetical protein
LASSVSLGRVGLGESAEVWEASLPVVTARSAVTRKGLSARGTVPPG